MHATDEPIMTRFNDAQTHARKTARELMSMDTAPSITKVLEFKDRLTGNKKRK